MTTTTRKPSGKMEKRAYSACQHIKETGSAEFSVVWKKSPTWGSSPSIHWRGEKAAHASGCGYDKESAVICEFLGWLSPNGFLKSSGAGFRSVQEELKSIGWNITNTYDGTNEDGYRIERI